MDISRNTKTDEIKKGSLGSFFRKGEWINCFNSDGTFKEGEEAFILAQELKEVKDIKKEEVKAVRSTRFIEPLFVKNIDNKPYYASVHPELNIFEASSLTDEFVLDSKEQPKLDANGDKIINSVRWGCYVKGKKELIDLTKHDLDNLAKHYKDRKGAAYNQCDLARAAIDELTTIEEVESYDITQVY